MLLLKHERIRKTENNEELKELFIKIMCIKEFQMALMLQVG